MQAYDTRQEPAQRNSPAADRHAGVAAASRLGRAAARGGGLQAAVGRSPSMLAQRRALDTLFGNAVQRRAGELDDETTMQMRAEPANQTGMPDSLKSGIEALSGMDMSDVRVHRNSGKPAQLNALAYAQGQDIHLGPGQEQHLAHEAWHVVQQRQGRVRETVQLAGVPVNDDEALETEADVMGQRAVA